MQSDATNGDSHVMKISIRAWLALIIVTTICAMSILGMTVVEPLYTIGSLAIGFYFGQKTSTPK